MFLIDAAYTEHYQKMHMKIGMENQKTNNNVPLPFSILSFIFGVLIVDTV